METKSFSVYDCVNCDYPESIDFLWRLYFKHGNKLIARESITHTIVKADSFSHVDDPGQLGKQNHHKECPDSRSLAAYKARKKKETESVRCVVLGHPY